MITLRKRIVRLNKGYPYVVVAEKRRYVKHVVTKGTDNPKTSKNSSTQWFPIGITMSPQKSAGIGNICPNAGACVQTCLTYTGKGASSGEHGETIHGSRIARTILWHLERELFWEMLHADMEQFIRKAERDGTKLCMRPNMLGDIPWEKYGLPQMYPDVQFYDYTKNPNRAGQMSSNYWVTFSRDSEKNEADCISVLRSGGNVAVCFDDGYTTGARNLHGPGPTPMPKTWKGFPVISGDDHDRRWEDPRGVVIGLKLKAASQAMRTKAIKSGFAVCP